jgi:hypothetical protein
VLAAVVIGLVSVVAGIAVGLALRMGRFGQGLSSPRQALSNGTYAACVLLAFLVAEHYFHWSTRR